MNVLRGRNCLLNSAEIYLKEKHEHIKNNVVCEILNAYIIYKYTEKIKSNYALHLMIHDENISKTTRYKLPISIKMMIKKIEGNNFFQEWLLKNVSQCDYYNET